MAKGNCPRIYALVMLLHSCALRIQDAVGLTFGSITNLVADRNGFRYLELAPKKTSARTVVIDSKTFAAIKAYQENIGATPKDVMFEPGDGRNPADKWSKCIRKFFR